MMDFTRALTLGSSVRYALWRTTGRRSTIPLRLRSGVRFLLRPRNRENGDYGVAYEVFVLHHYRPPADLDLGRPRLVVDLGGNVGLSVLHWLNLFPGCRVETFEPNPRHLTQMRRNFALCGVAERVAIHAQAAGAEPRMLRLSDLGTSSSTLGTFEEGFEVEAADVLAHIGGRRVDLMKMNIEGSEYEVLADDRFGSLDIGCIVMEWHSAGGGEIDRLWCERRLARLGYVIRPLFAKPDHGMFWAIRANANPPVVAAIG